MYKNLTPHEITFLGEDGMTIIGHVLPCGEVARVEDEVRTTACRILLGSGSVPLDAMSPGGKVVGLPPQEKGVDLLVSRAVAMTCPFRPDLYFPGRQVRDDKGRVVGCQSLAFNAALACAMKD